MFAKLITTLRRPSLAAPGATPTARSTARAATVTMTAALVGAGAVGVLASPAAADTRTSPPSSLAAATVPAPTPVPGGSIAAVKVFSATDAWAVGEVLPTTGVTTRTLIQRWNGRTWRVVPSPSPDPSFNALRAIDGAAPNDVWAIGNIGDDGYGGNSAGLVLRWNGSAWSQVDVPGARGVNGDLVLPTLTGVVARATNDVRIVGQAFHRGLFRVVPIFLQWDGQRWHDGFIADGSTP